MHGSHGMVMGQNCCVHLLIRYRHEMSPNQGSKAEYGLKDV